MDGPTTVPQEGAHQRAEAEAGYPNWPNLAVLFFDCARRFGQRPAVWHHQGGAWVSSSWDTLAEQAAALSHTLATRGTERGDRVLILSENRPEFLVADVAAMTLGAIAVPIFTTYTEEDLTHVLRDCDPSVAIVSTPELYRKLIAADQARPTLDLIVAIHPVDRLAGPDLLTWAEATRARDAASPESHRRVAEQSASTVDREQLACLIYTSGTGGSPKGVALPHRAVLSNCRGAHALLLPLALKDEIYLSFLPLSHSFEHTCGQFFLLSIGTQVYYSRGAERLAHEMLEVRPTTMTAVPRLFEVIRHRIEQQAGKSGWFGRNAFALALALGLRRLERGRLGPVDLVLDALVGRMIRRRVQARFGGRLKGIMSGGARLDPEVGRFFIALGVPIMQGYGQTEAGPVVSANPPGSIRIDTVGRPLEGVEVRIAEDGEVLVRGELVMAGYWNNPEATRQVLDTEGWLRTGDIGSLDSNGYLRITDRKKDIIVLSGGDNVSPVRVEGILCAQPSIAQAAVAGDGRAYLVSVIVAPEGTSLADVATGLESANRRLALHERVRRFVIAGEPFTVANGLLTPTQKMKRSAVLKRYRAEIDDLYG